MSLFTFIIIFLLGLIIGSFLNVVIYRLQSHESIVVGRSKCPSCQRTLTALELIPLLSFIILRGQCRSCQQKISWQYPLVELATGLLFVISFYFHGANWLLLLRDFIAVSSLIVIFVSDWLYMIIPDEVALPAIVIIFILNWLTGSSVMMLLISLIIGVGFFALQYFISRGVWVGGGDLRLGGLVGALLGWPLVLVALFVSYVIGALVALGLLLSKKVTPKTQIPFGIFLAPSALLILFFGEKILGWYLGLL